MKLIMESWREYSKSVIKESSLLDKVRAGIREKAVLDILSVWSQPDASREISASGLELTSYEAPMHFIEASLFKGPDYQTTGTDYRPYENDNPIPDEAVAKQFGANVEGISFLRYMLAYMESELGLIRGKTAGVGPFKLTTRGAREFRKRFGQEKEYNPDAMQLGKSRKMNYKPSDAQLGKGTGRKFDPARYTEK